MVLTFVPNPENPTRGTYINTDTGDEEYVQVRIYYRQLRASSGYWLRSCVRYRRTL
jgi:hypothetical protein